MGGLFSLGGLGSALMFLDVLRDTFPGAASGLSGYSPEDRQLGDSLDQVMSRATATARKKAYQVTVRQVGGADDRIHYIKKMIRKYRYDPHVREIAATVLTRKNGSGGWKVPEKDWSAEVKAMFNFVRKNVRYTRDTVGRDMYASPNRSLAANSGDCDCYAILLGSLLQSVGYPIVLRIIQTHGNKTWNHIYLLVGLPPTRPTKWLLADASINKPLGFQAPAYMVERHKDFTV